MLLQSVVFACCYKNYPFLSGNTVSWEDECVLASLLSHGFCGLHCTTPIYRLSSLIPKKKVSIFFNTILKIFFLLSFFFFLKESQSSLDIKNKLGTTKQTENGQLEPQSKVPAEDLALTFRLVNMGLQSPFAQQESDLTRGNLWFINNTPCYIISDMQAPTRKRSHTLRFYSACLNCSWQVAVYQLM